MPHEPAPPRLIEQVRREMRLLHRSPRTEKTYIWWIRKFIRFHGLRNPRELDEVHVREFLMHLANVERSSASTQNQALAALRFLFERTLRRDLDWRHDLHAKRPQRVPDTLSIAECNAIVERLPETYRLATLLLWGSGLRVTECLTLRMKDVDLERRTLTVRAGKGEKDRMTPLAERALPLLRWQMERMRARHLRDAVANVAVPLPGAFSTKDPSASLSLGWYWLFPSSRIVRQPATRALLRWFMHPSGLQRVLKLAAQEAGIVKRVHCHCFRHSFATQLIEHGTDIRTIQVLMGHADVKQTMRYTHITKKGALGVKSPVDY